MSNPIREVRSDAAPPPLGPYAQAVVAGGFVFASGQLPLDPASGELVGGDTAAQTERVIANLRAVLEAAGASLSRVVRTTVYLADLAEWPRMNEVYTRHFRGDPKPARTAIQAGALPRGAALEMDAIAAL
jgi:2-iminobutanoate/2-iminopropanoate deaminase